MATSTKGEAHAIAARAAKVPGWTVTKPRGLSGAYKIQAPDGNITQVHLSPSDNNWKHSVMRSLNASGFEEAEAKAEERAKAAKAIDMEKQRLAAEEKARRILSENAMLQKARGPYAEPEEVEDSWFTTPHPRPWVRWVLMTPRLARLLFEKHNLDNRAWRRKTVDHYKAVILSGQWHLTHQGMAMDTRGIVQDGQHRLMAIMEAEVTCPVAFFVGMPISNFKAIDEGLLRRAADLIGKDGTQYAALSAAVMKLVDAYDSNDPRRNYHAKITNETVYDLFQLDAENLRDSVRWGSSNYKKCKMNATGLAAAHYLIRKTNGRDNAYVEAFFQGMVTGVKGSTRVILDEDDPRQKIRDLFTNWRDKGKRVNALENCALIVATWNYVIHNDRPRFIRLAENMETPKVGKCDDKGPHRSGVPVSLTLEIATMRRDMEMAGAH